jgi:ABC-type uncharacterized transport system permease subunit
MEIFRENKIAVWIFAIIFSFLVFFWGLYYMDWRGEEYLIYAFIIITAIIMIAFFITRPSNKQNNK